ncbi:hypothetical protein ARMGADRAFT_1031489 [Armillaria gallica]|uniref:Uncharacterized protein n=1 Tax=Armillaria gallica TaxID=47427 RepID=A0A2H3D9W5_ARMGA|nr:hypothetical protein ARMGADRAFT_1031489 [Armillaria gallica]
MFMDMKKIQLVWGHAWLLCIANLQSRVNNSCFTFGQSLLGLVVKGDKTNVLVLVKAMLLIYKKRVPNMDDRSKNTCKIIGKWKLFYKLVYDGSTSISLLTVELVEQKILNEEMNLMEEKMETQNSLALATQTGNGSAIVNVCDNCSSEGHSRLVTDSSFKGDCWRLNLLIFHSCLLEAKATH